MPFFIGLMWLALGLNAQANNRDLQSVLLELDSLVAAKPSTHARHEAKIDSLRKRAGQVKDKWEKYALYGSLFYEYLHYQADSSFYYVAKKESMLPLLDSLDLYNEVLINRAEVYRVMGLCLETEETLKMVNPAIMSPGMRGYYYSVYCSHYTNMAQYVAAPYGGREYTRKASLYRDSILTLLSPDVDHDIVFSEQLLQTEDPVKVTKRLEKLLEKTTDAKQRTYLHYTLSGAYRMQADTASAAYHLAQTAMLDLRFAVREYAALQKLAWLLFLQGDTQRAYVYAACSFEDALACKAQQRMRESGEFNAIIGKAIKEMREKKDRATRRVMFVGGLLFVLVVLVAAGAIWWMKKLAEMRAELADMNSKLEASNKELSQTGKIKEAYIAQYLNRCVYYLDSMEQERRSLEKLAMSSKIEDLFKAIRSTDRIRNERKNFYMEFDRSFLELFPHFIDDFNSLLVDGEKVVPKPGELLNPELRIFALIRLGISDSNRIAHFLSYSLTTIYNYRSKIRNKVQGDKDSFEDRVMKL